MTSNSFSHDQKTVQPKITRFCSSLLGWTGPVPRRTSMVFFEIFPWKPVGQLTRLRRATARQVVDPASLGATQDTELMVDGQEGRSQ
jgi:hypothetical protein